MPEIKQLPESLIAHIAAGEVVQRPASAVKELLENSLDAGADFISLTIEGAGRKRLVVSDNGCGMTLDGAKTALKRHATSKISDLSDLEKIGTYGFRGEALPSIAAVSKITLTTRSIEEDCGWQLVIEGGKIISEKPMAREPGTTIDIRDLFFNTPARFKFLKSDSTERGQILRAFEDMAFSNLGCSFEIKNEKEKPVRYQAQAYDAVQSQLAALKKRAGEIWKSTWEKAFWPVFAETNYFSVSGVVTHPGHHQSGTQYQRLYVNRRPVMNRRLARAVYTAYTGQLPSLRHPGWILYLEVNPITVDVNVHPAKHEVKLTHESEIFSFLVAEVKKALGANKKIPVELHTTPTDARHIITPAVVRGQVPTSDISPKPEKSRMSGLDPLDVGLDLWQGVGGIKEEKMRAVAQIGQTFILVESQDGLVIVDQHAAAEKVVYEKLMANTKAKEPTVQLLLVPFSWELASSLKPVIQGKLKNLHAMGFVIEPFGGNTMLVKGHPSVLGEKYDLHSLLDGLSDILLDSDAPRGGIDNDFNHRLAALTACKASVRAGDALDLKSCQKIVEDVVRCEAPWTCPHGRPTMIRHPFSELERRFRRT